ncbi:MAG: pilus assembly protein PilZ [Gammaproteobacteria bacterium]|nr:pilus assembly protein PilZ [Gammaproteobacteria bacterium]
MSPFTDLIHTLPVVHKRQTGASLVVSLMLLVVLTLLGLSSMQSTIMQERMSNNVRDKGLAFQAAESAVRGGEDWVKNQDISKLKAQNGSSCSPPCNLVNLDDYLNMAGQNFNWWETNGRAYIDMPTGVVASAPRFIVEEHSIQRDSLADSTDNNSPPVRTLYRLTAVGVGGTITAESIIETLYARID